MLLIPAKVGPEASAGFAGLRLARMQLHVPLLTLSKLAACPHIPVWILTTLTVKK